MIEITIGLLTFILGFILGGKLILNGYRDEAVTGYISIDKQVYKVIKLEENKNE